MSKAKTWILGFFGFNSACHSVERNKNVWGGRTRNQHTNFYCHSKHIIIMQHKIFTKNNAKSQSSANFFQITQKFPRTDTLRTNKLPLPYFSNPSKNMITKSMLHLSQKITSVYWAKTQDENFNKTCRLIGRPKDDNNVLFKWKQWLLCCTPLQ